MEESQFDSTLGGTEHLPNSANSLKFASSRSIEIAAMTESIFRPSNTKLIFQSLPVHMRRRVMSHNCKRLPRKLREGHLEQLKKSGLPPKQKRPSRKYRRRPANLLEEYNRRQKRNIWLETHIWHAKRFHMIERWGHRLAHAPCDKAFRACYRASSAHCLLQDISYYTPIKVTGRPEYIQEMFSCLSTPVTGLGICAKAYMTGNREGTIHMYKANSYPYGYIGKVTFIWVPSDSSARTLWLFVHPAQANQIESVLADLLCSDIKSSNNEIPEKRRKLVNNYSEQVKIKVLPGIFNRFRLTGPNSHAVLAHSLKSVDNIEKLKSSQWLSCLNQKSELYLKENHDYWQDIKYCSSPSQLSSRLILGLVVRDPRLSRPSKRTKAQTENNDQISVKSLLHFPKSISHSPLWDTNAHEAIKTNKLSNLQFTNHVRKTQLVPGTVYLEDPAVQSVPVVLVQRPGSQESIYKKLGYGSGWDIIVPSGYGVPFWHTFIMFGGRSGGLRETESLAFEMGECYMPPDSNAGREEEKRIESELRERYFKLPPSKRVNYTKLAVNSPFIPPWKVLLKDWSNTTVEDFFILRNKKLLDTLQDCLKQKKKLPEMEHAAQCLVAVYIQMHGKGNLKRHALMCLPQSGDIGDIKNLFEPHHADPHEKLRKQKRTLHLKNLKQWRRQRVKLRKKGVLTVNKTQKICKKVPSEYVKSMRELWVPSNTQTVRHSAAREIVGYLSQGAFSFSEAKSCGIGYIPYIALSTLLKSGHNQILIRNTSSRKYRLADLHIVKSG
ncbi:ribonucleases P/MRP protein subunit POP1 [Pectinophora gossypiella]|uniref:Uncharacterized protein n=1 Tax=Pectinophora gossypiella TaxID=13191 RepID=A0A1E1WFI7_PECGO|nr:ribonucleases P/MRP protein subunit POP1 [Pectinophora gossypiella]